MERESLGLHFFFLNDKTLSGVCPPLLQQRLSDHHAAGHLGGSVG